MASSQSEMLVPQALEDKLSEARQAARAGQALAELKFRTEFLDLVADSDQVDIDRFARVRARIAHRQAELNAAAETLGEARELAAPRGLVFAIWSRTHAMVPGFRKADGLWQPAAPAPLRVDERIYPDGFAADADQPTPIKHTALTAVAIRADLVDTADELSTQGVYAYADVMADCARYLITDPAFAVGLLPEPDAGMIFVRSEDDSPWTQTSFS